MNAVKFHSSISLTGFEFIHCTIAFCRKITATVIQYLLCSEETVSCRKISLLCRHNVSTPSLHFRAVWIEWYFLNQSKVKPKSNVSLSHAFSCAWNLWHYLCTLSSDWLIKLFTPVVIGWSVYSSFGCKILTGNLLNPNFYLEKVWRNKQSPQTRAGQRPHYKISSKK